jgi:eukaryotic-like serine/threonine-protein kinase
VALQIGQELGSYEITSVVGKGGMGEVYRARDTRLKRDVAIKVLPLEFSREPENVARFQREAEALASLNHQNIAGIYDLQQVDATRFLVMEFVEGDTLAAILKKRGALPLDLALNIGEQICDALETAHEKGIVHRDLKPANIKVMPDGKVKVLDFGLAKMAVSSTVEPPDLPTRVTLSSPGIIMGTPAYMSPEQVRGEEAGRQTDIWSFGCVVFEMLTGDCPFAGETVAETLAKVIEAKPDFDLMPPQTPEPVRRMLRSCLQKERKRRLHDIADARMEIEEAVIHPSAVTPSTKDSSRRKERLIWVSAVILLAAIVAVLSFTSLSSLRTASEMRFEIITPGAMPTPAAISPDGQKIVYAARSAGRSQLWLRTLDSVSARPLSQTDDGSAPFWSPDNRSVGFFAGGKLKRIDIEGESMRVLATATADIGGTWNRDNVILFAPTPGSPIFRVSATGGEATAVTRLAPGESGHRGPHFLPDGRHFLYFVAGNGERNGVHLGQIDSSETRRLMDADSAAIYAASGQLLFARQRKLYAQDFDVKRLELKGNVYAVGDVAAEVGIALISSSASGPILYRANTGITRRHLEWFDRKGTVVSTISASESDGLQTPSMSPDGRNVAFSRMADGNQDIWLLELSRGVLRRFTFDPLMESFPIWSQDGSRMVFNSGRKGVLDLYQKQVEGAESDAPLLATPRPKGPNDWSPDGRFLLYRSPDPKTGFDIWALPMNPPGEPFPVVQTNFDERDAQFSPDGKWIAYQSNESGPYQIYVQPFPGPGNRLQVSNSGGAQVRWRSDGKELFYIALDDRLMAVPIQFASASSTIEAGAPVPLFVTRVGGAVQPLYRQQYVVSKDGQTFLMNTAIDESNPTLTLVLNWNPRR